MSAVFQYPTDDDDDAQRRHREAAQRIAGRRGPRIAFAHVERAADPGDDLSIPAPPRPMFVAMPLPAERRAYGQGYGGVIFGSFCAAAFLYAVSALAGLAE